MKNTLVGKLYPIWLSSQTDLAKVVRWKPYVEKNKKLRVQTTEDHLVSVKLAVQAALCLMRCHAAPYDIALLSLAFDLHDLPEGYIGEDTVLFLKNDRKDLKEYLAFKDKIKHLPSYIYYPFEEAYLLQFAQKCPSCFPKAAKETMLELRLSNPLEVAAFPALESWEYVFYAWEDYVCRGTVTLLVHVLRNQLKNMSQYKKLPGFSEAIFTKKYETWAIRFVEKHKRVPTQEKYFGL